LIGNRLGDLALDGEDIGQIAIVGLCPQMRVGPRVEQLRIYPHFIGRALHAPFDDMCHAELLSDLAQIARRAAFVLHDARAADHFQVGNLGQMGQDLVLDALGEEGVRFFFAQIFKRKNGDALVHGSGEGTSRCFAQKREKRSGERHRHQQRDPCGCESDAHASRAACFWRATLQTRC
jgi:hypothetical protein